MSLLLVFFQGAIPGAHSADAGRANQPPRPERRHLARQVSQSSSSGFYKPSNPSLLDT